MADKDNKKKGEVPATPSEEAPEQGQQRQIQVRMDDSDMNTIYANGFRTTKTAEEVLLDFGLNVPLLSEQPEGQPVYQLNLETRIIMNYGAVRRLVQALAPLVATPAEDPAPSAEE
jgi:hypothetical protein